MTRVLQLAGLPVYKEDKSEGREGREAPSRPPLYCTPSGPESLQPLARCGPSCKDSVREDIVSLPYALIPLSLRTPFRRQSIVSYPLPGHVLCHMFCHLICHLSGNPWSAPWCPRWFLEPSTPFGFNPSHLLPGRLVNCRILVQTLTHLRFESMSILPI